MPTADYLRARYRRKRQAGMCVRCSQSTTAGRSLCDQHRAERSSYLKARYHAMRQALLNQQARTDAA